MKSRLIKVLAVVSGGLFALQLGSCAATDALQSLIGLVLPTA